MDDIFKYCVCDKAKADEYGFKIKNGDYVFETTILNGQFNLFIFITDGGVKTKLIDAESNDEYALHLHNGGEFVGKIRAEIESALLDIKEKCFKKEIYKQNQTKRIIEFVKNKFGTEIEFLWKKFPTYSVMRRKENQKWYGALLSLSKRKLGIESDETCEIINLRYKNNAEIINRKTIFEGYHFNKKNWISICLDGSENLDFIFNLIDNSYALALKSK